MGHAHQRQRVHPSVVHGVIAAGWITDLAGRGRVVHHADTHHGQDGAGWQQLRSLVLELGKAHRVRHWLPLEEMVGYGWRHRRAVPDRRSTYGAYWPRYVAISSCT